MSHFTMKDKSQPREITFLGSCAKDPGTKLDWIQKTKSDSLTSQVSVRDALADPRVRVTSFFNGGRSNVPCGGV